MRIHLYLVAILILPIGCENEKDNESPSNDSLNITYLLDTLESNYWLNIVEPNYELDINNDDLKDVVFEISDSFGSNGSISSIKIQGLNNSTIAFVQKKDTTWVYSPNLEEYKDTVWTFHDFKQVKPYHFKDTILSITDFTNTTLVITEKKGSGIINSDPEQSFIDRKSLIGKGELFLGLKIDQYLTWIKIEILDYSEIVIHSYLFSENTDYLIIRE